MARKTRLVAAERLECSPDDVVLADVFAHVAGVPSRALTLGSLAQAAVRSPVLARESQPGLQACGFFYPATVTWAFGAHACVVDVDTETGTVAILRYVAVHDSGRPINPLVVEGQLHGGIAQGIGTAFCEEIVNDEQGQLLTGTLMDYGLPRADSVPALDVMSLDYPSVVNDLGIKGVGESGIISSSVVIANAVEDALIADGASPAEMLFAQLPVTPARVWEAIRRVSSSSSSSQSRSTSRRSES